MGRAPKVEDTAILREIALWKHPVVTASDLSEILDYSTDGVRNRLETLENKGYVDSRSVGARARVWWLTDEGRSQL